MKRYFDFDTVKSLPVVKEFTWMRTLIRPPGEFYREVESSIIASRSWAADFLRRDNDGKIRN